VVSVTIDRTQDAFCAGQLAANRAKRYAAFANAEECAQVAVVRSVENNALA
jgi:hypothetical protein